MCIGEKSSVLVFGMSNHHNLPNAYVLGACLMPILLETERLSVRPWTRDDVEPAFAILGDPEVTRYLGETGEAFADRDRIREWLGRMVARTAEWSPLGSWAVVENATGDIIGG